MSNKWTPVLTFVLGVTLTIGVYESIRLVRNTSRALAVASNQMSADAEVAAAPPVARRGPRKVAAERRAAAVEDEERPPVLTAQPRAAVRQPGTPVKTKAIRAGANQRASIAERRAILQERLENMSEEEIEAWRAKREARRQRQRERLQALRARMDDPQAVDAPAFERPEPIEEPAEIQDTALPQK